jgi:hypothetical protein
MLTIFGETYSLEALKSAWPVLWDTSSNNNPYLKTDAFSVSIFPITYGSYIAGYKVCTVISGKVSKSCKSDLQSTLVPNCGRCQRRRAPAIALACYHVEAR